jgi:hypothetical protein
MWGSSVLTSAHGKTGCGWEALSLSDMGGVALDLPVFSRAMALLFVASFKATVGAGKRLPVTELGSMRKRRD